MKTYKQCERCKYIFEIKYFNFFKDWGDIRNLSPYVSFGYYSKICKECAKEVGEKTEKNWKEKK